MNANTEIETQMICLEKYKNKTIEGKVNLEKVLEI